MRKYLDEIIIKGCKVKVFDHYFANESAHRFNVVDSYVIFDVVRPYIGNICIEISLAKIDYHDIDVDRDYNTNADDIVFNQITIDNIVFDDEEYCASLEDIYKVLQMSKDDFKMFFDELKKNVLKLEDIQILIKDVEDCFAEYYSADNLDEGNDDRYHQQKEDASGDEDFYYRLKEMNHE